MDPEIEDMMRDMQQAPEGSILIVSVGVPSYGMVFRKVNKDEWALHLRRYDDVPFTDRTLAIAYSKEQWVIM